MILWLALFFLVIAISFILALQSMREYQEIPLKSKEEYDLYLIRNVINLDAKLLKSLREHIAADGLLISIERLFKGQKAALTIFGPKRVLGNFRADLSLLELEDYSLNLNNTDIYIWEMGTKNKELKIENLQPIFSNLPALSEEEQFFWQVVLGAKEGRSEAFQSQIRAAVYSKDPARRRELAHFFQNLSNGGLIKVPRPYSPEQMTSFYRLRSLGKDSQGPILHPEKVVDLVKIS